ncbi:MAG: DUF2628 domain-containing protein [Rhodospirillales bacterium]|nr:DUF2628 domain-containing protein [Rhodospirillales bacterium]
MRMYSVHLRRPLLNPDRDICLVKEGFSWPAFFFSVLWALWCRLWLAAAGIFAAEIALSGVMSLLGADEMTQAAISVGFAVLLGVVANDIKRWSLFRRGFLQVAVVTGEDSDAAERRFWDQRPSLAADLVG